MIYSSDLTQLITQWQSRYSRLDYSPAYRDALLECIYDLQSCIINAQIREASAKELQDYLDSLEADSYLSSLEAHDPAA